MLGAGRRESDPLDPRCRCRRVIECAARGHCAQPIAAAGSICARFRAPNPNLSPMEIWCNEAQERYVLALVPGSVERFAALCERERCPLRWWARSPATGAARHDPLLSSTPVDMPIEVLLGKAPRMTRSVRSVPKRRAALRHRGREHCRFARSAVVSADDRRQVLPDHHRRSHGRAA